MPPFDRRDAPGLVLAAVVLGLLGLLVPAHPATAAPVPAAPPPAPAAAPLPAVPPARAVVLTDREDAPEGSAAGRTVALTFDDGPDPRWTPQVLALLREHGAVATFCVIGKQVRGHEDVVRSVVDAGMRLCDHTRSHPGDLPESPPERRAAEVDGARADLAAVTDAPVPYFRAPQGRWSPDVVALAADRGMQPLGWSVDSGDWRRPGVDAIVATVQRQVHPGAVVLLHDGGGHRDQTVAALRVLLLWFAAQGYAFAFPT